jgi:Flp pilus assembly protein TadG
MGSAPGSRPSFRRGRAGWRAWRAEHGDRGASLVEFAIVLPVLALLLFGVIEFGLTLNDYQSVRQGAREGARNAVVEDFGAVTSCGLDGGAATAPDNAKRVICMTKASVGLSDVRVRIDFTDTNPGFVNDKLQVCVTRQVDSITGLFQPFLSGVNLRTQIEMRAEKDLRLPNGVTSEIDPSGDNWNWC